jgi:hypothetical protein
MTMNTLTSINTSRMQSRCEQPHTAPVADVFAAEVLRHLQAMPDAEWARLRALGNDARRFVNHSDVALPNLTREELVERFVSVDACSIEDVLVPGYKEKAIRIAEIEGRALFYVQREGVYVMEEKRTGCLPMTRALWVTMPAYPPTW